MAGAFAARVTRAAAHVQAQTTWAAAVAAAEPAHRQQDLEMVGELRTDQGRMRSLILAFTLYVGELTRTMHEHSVPPPEPPERIKEYNRTGQ